MLHTNYTVSVSKGFIETLSSGNIDEFELTMSSGHTTVMGIWTTITSSNTDHLKSV